MPNMEIRKMKLLVGLVAVGIALVVIGLVLMVALK